MLELNFEMTMYRFIWQLSIEISYRPFRHCGRYFVQPNSNLQKFVETLGIIIQINADN